MNRAALEALRAQADAVLRRAETCHASVPVATFRNLLDALLAPEAGACPSCGHPIRAGLRHWCAPIAAPEAMVTTAGVPITTADTPCGRGELSAIRASIPYARAEREAWRAARARANGSA